MEITRRDFVRYATASAGALGLSKLRVAMSSEVMAASAKPAVVWLSGSGCTGCSVSLLNAVSPGIDSVLVNTIDLRYHPNVMAAAGDMAVAAARSTQQEGGYVLVVEGAIPTASSGKYCYVWSEKGREVTMAEAVSSLAASAAQVVAVGTCASFGGIPAKNSTTGVVGLGAFLGRPVVNLPGCPAHPDWIIGSLVQLLTGPAPALDAYSRPTAYYRTQHIHERCPRREAEEASTFGENGACLEELGCKGPRSHADCDTRKWNNGQAWCIGVNGLCIGCVEPDFPSFPFHQGGAGASPAPTPTPTPRATPTPGSQPGGSHKVYLPSVIDGLSQGGAR